MANTVIHVEGMTCNHCKMSVEKALKTLDGVQEASVDIKAKTVSVIFDPGVTDANNLKNAINNAGYEAK